MRERVISRPFNIEYESNEDIDADRGVSVSQESLDDRLSVLKLPLSPHDLSLHRSEIERWIDKNC